MDEKQGWAGSVYAPSKKRKVDDWEWARLLVIVRDGHRCKVSGCKATRKLELHHIWPVAEGGKDDIENLVLVCRKHHDEIEDAGTVRSMEDVISWDIVPRRPISERSVSTSNDWHTWVYGGARNPQK